MNFFQGLWSLRRPLHLRDETPAAPTATAATAPGSAAGAAPWVQRVPVQTAVQPVKIELLLVRNTERPTVLHTISEIYFASVRSSDTPTRKQGC